MVGHMQIAAEVTEPACPESDIYNALLSLDDCNIVELGCGAAELTRDIATGGRNRSILALEVDRAQRLRRFRKTCHTGDAFGSSIVHGRVSRSSKTLCRQDDRKWWPLHDPHTRRSVA